MIRHGKLIFEYNRITEYIYLGTNQCCQMHFKKELLDKGIKAEISLEKENLDAPRGVKYYLWLPVKDHFAPTLEQMKIGTNFIEKLINNKIKVYIHCKMGHGRSPTLTAAYLISKGKTVKEAVDFIKKRRKSIHINKIQIDALKRYRRSKFFGTSS